jgi:hypothetical protein
MKRNLVWLIIASLFLGFICVGVAIGGVFPSTFRVFSPLVCNGKMEVDVQRYSYRPGEVTTNNNFYCIDETTGEKRDISALTVVVGSLVSSGIIFLLFCAMVLTRRLKKRQPEIPPLPTTVNTTPPGVAPEEKAGPPVEDQSEVLRKLKELRMADLISEQEYEAKKAEILSRM